MQVKFLILILFFAPTLLYAKQEQDELEIPLAENDLELFEFLAMYEKDDTVFIDSEMDDKTKNADLTSQQVNTSESNE